MNPMSVHPCGCAMGTSEYMNPVIVYCPLHAHAPAMRKALDRIGDTIDNSYLLEAGRFRQIEAIFNKAARALLKEIDG